MIRERDPEAFERDQACRKLAQRENRVDNWDRELAWIRKVIFAAIAIAIVGSVIWFATNGGGR